MHVEHNLPSVLRKSGLRAQEVLSYIALGRNKVRLHPKHDPYYKSSLSGMTKDAMTIASWFNANRKKWSDGQLADVYAQIIRIQRGPGYWWQEWLRKELTPTQFSAAQSWASREHEAPGTVNLQANAEVYIAVLHAVRYRGRLNRWPSINEGLIAILQLAFFGPKLTPGDNWTDL